MYIFGHAIKFRKHRWCGQADILLHGLTVITGGNDLGKSTISKMLFSMVKEMPLHESPVRITDIETWINM